MATTFKFWSRGKPLDNILTNTSTLAFWSRGGPVSTFGEITGGTIVHVDRLSLLITPLAVSNRLGFTVFIGSPLSVSVTLTVPRICAGPTEEIQVDATGSTLVYTEVPGTQVDAAGIQIVYTAGTSIIASAPLLSLTWTFLDPSFKLDFRLSTNTIHLVFTPNSSSTFAGTAIVEATGLSVAYDPIPRVDVCQAGILVGYVTTSPHIVAYPPTQHLVLTSFGTPNVIPVETLHLNFELHGMAPGDEHAVIDVTAPLVISPLEPIVSFGCRIAVETLHLIVTPCVVTISIDYTLVIGNVLSLLVTVIPPVITLGATISDTAHLTLTQQPPTTYVVFNVIAIAPILHLVDSIKAVSVKCGCKAFPTTQQLTITLQPAVGATGAALQEAAHLVISTLAPTIITGIAVVASPQVLHLQVTSLGVSTFYDFTVEVPSANSLLVTPLEVNAATGAAIQEVLPLVLTQLEPAIYTEVFVIATAPLMHLSISIKAVSIKINWTVFPDTVHLVLTPIAPQVVLGVKIYETLHLVISKLAPTVLYDYTVPLNTQHVILSPYVPFIRRSASAFPNLLSLTLTYIDPVVTTGARIYETLGLILFPETAIGSSSTTLFLSTLHLTFIQKPAVARVSTHFTVDLLNLILTSYDAEAFTGVRIDTTLHLVFTKYIPFIRTCVVETPDPLHIIITPHGPGIMPMIPVTGDILHKERDWAAEFSWDFAQYADRPAAALSENFPFSTLEFPNMTVCFWVRFKSFGNWPNVYVGLVSKANCFTIMAQTAFLYVSLFRPRWDSLTEDRFPVLSDCDFRFTTNRWYHVGISIESQTGKIYSQIWDDFLQQMVAARDNHQGIYPILPPYNVGDGSFSVGRDPTNLSFFDGYLDELVLFNDIRSPMEMDAIRQGRYCGQLSGQAVADTSLQVGYDTHYGIKVAANSLMVGYNEAPVRKVDSTGLMVGYILEPIPEIPPPPVIGGLAGGGAGEGSIDFCHLSYKFKTEVYAYDYGSDQEGRFETYTYPTRHLEASLGSADQGAYFHIMGVLRSGAAIFSAPIWALRSTIVEHARAGQTIIAVDDASNYNAGEKMIIMRANDTEIFDLATITHIDGNTLYVQDPLAHHYHPFRMPSLTQRYDERSSYIAPCMTGLVEVEDHGLRGPRPSFFVKVKVDGGVWPGAQIAPEIPIFTEVPLRGAYVAPRIEKTTAGTEDGILQIMAHFSTSRLAFEVEWSFIDSKWKLLRELFLAAKGRSKPFRMPTWAFELVCLESASAGSTTIKLSPGFNPLWERFKFLYATPTVGSPFVIKLTQAFIPGSIVHMSGFTPLSQYHTFTGDHISGGGFLPGPLVPGTLVFNYNCGSPYHTLTDNGEGLLVGPGVVYGYIIYSTPATFLYNIEATTDFDVFEASFDYEYQGAEYYGCEPLTQDIQAGDRICLYPQVRFLEDELIFEFLDIGKCAAKVSFIEVLP